MLINVIGINRIIGEYDEQFHANKFSNLDEIDLSAWKTQMTKTDTRRNKNLKNFILEKSR